MASERMMQAIGTLERAISRLEQATAQSVPTPPAPASPHIDEQAARAALRSLDDLITELKDRNGG